MANPTGRIGSIAGLRDELAESGMLHRVSPDQLSSVLHDLPGLPRLTDADKSAALNAHMQRALEQDLGPEEQRAIVGSTLEQFYSNHNTQPAEDSIMTLLLGNESPINAAASDQDTQELETLDLNPADHEIYLAKVYELAEMYRYGAPTLADIKADAEAKGFLPDDLIAAVKELEKVPNSNIEITREVKLATVEVLPAAKPTEITYAASSGPSRDAAPSFNM